MEICRKQEVVNFPKIPSHKSSLSVDGGLRLACWPLLGAHISPHSRPLQKASQTLMVSGRGVCNFLGSVSSQQKFEATDQLYSSRMDQCYSSVLFGK